MSLEAALKAQLHAGVTDLNLSLTPAQETALLQYLAQLQKWGAVFNLTAIKNPLDALHLHLLDCLALVASLRRRFAGQSLAILDVGSGAGLPAIVLAICSDPDKAAFEVTSVDAVEKKIAFQRQQKVLLQLPNLHPVHHRIETFAAHSFDLITCRAFANVADFCQQSRHLIKNPEHRNQAHSNATWVAMKANPEVAELAKLKRLNPPVNIIEVEAVQVPGLDAQRQFIWLK
jgi:16S rRNA (guanine527-N7)-methyltransferase